MKVILNEDVKHLGELGDLKDVATGYARNYLLPHGLAVVCNEENLKLFKDREKEIQERKEAKRRNSASLKDKLEATTISLAMPCGVNGKLYGAVTNQTLAEYLTKNGYEIERKRIEIPGVTIKNTGNYHFTVRLYEGESATVKLIVTAQEEKQLDVTPAIEKQNKEPKTQPAVLSDEATKAEDVSQSSQDETPVQKQEQQ